MINYDFLINVSDVLRKGIDRNSFADSLSNTQYLSKKWLVEELAKIEISHKKRVKILGGWYGSYLIPFLKKNITPTQIILNDLDPDCLYFAEILHGKKNMMYECYDVFKMPSKIYSFHPEIIINTSCEHMDDMKNLIDKNMPCLYALQSCTSKNDPGHINYKTTLDEFLFSTGLNSILFYGTKDLGHKKRHMIIGYA